MTKLKIIAICIIGLTGYLVWGAMAYYDPAQRDDFRKFNIMMATGAIGLVLRDMTSQPPKG